jgi:nitrate reductase cytochrome c-type subunit
MTMKTLSVIKLLFFALLLSGLMASQCKTENKAVSVRSVKVKNSSVQLTEGRESGWQKRRAFYTAPPVMPHRYGRRDKDCRYCHSQVKEYKGKTSAPSPHPKWVNCMQCHVRRGVPGKQGLVRQSVENSWQGLKEPEAGPKSHEGAPSVIPHRLFLRENCKSCHDREHPEKSLRSPHANKVNCQQCHVARSTEQF